MELKPDFGKTAADYRRFRAGFPDSLFDRLAAMGIGAAGQPLLDLGTGTGSLARGFALRGARAIALDKSAALLDEARRLDGEVGVEIRYLVATAEDTGLTGANFDVVTAGQCWHWFDRQRAAREVRRILVPGGRLVIAHFDWLALPGNVAEATEHLVEHHNPRWKLGGGAGIYPQWLRDCAVAGFEELETFSYDTCVSYAHLAWRGRIRACAGVAASLAAEQVTAFDRDLQAMLRERFPLQPLKVPHRVFALIGRAPREDQGIRLRRSET